MVFELELIKIQELSPTRFRKLLKSSNIEDNEAVLEQLALYRKGTRKSSRLG